MRGRHGRRLAAHHDIDQQRLAQQLRQLAHLVLVDDRLDEQDVRARLGETPGALDGGVETLDSARVGAGDDEEILVAPRVGRRLDLRHHLGQRRHALAGEVAAALGKHLVFQLDGIGPGALQHPHGMPYIDRVAEAGVGVDDQGQLDRIADARGRVGHVAQADDAQVRRAVMHVGQARAGQVDRLEPLVRHDPGAHRVERARHQHAIALRDPFAQHPFGRIAHCPCSPCRKPACAGPPLMMRSPRRAASRAGRAGPSSIYQAAPNDSWRHAQDRNGRCKPLPGARAGATAAQAARAYNFSWIARPVRRAIGNGASKIARRFLMRRRQHRRGAQGAHHVTQIYRLP
ncbi:Uncharacterised protein [Bordetella pertussis]|nr:Uncharacterised protein [Bordetella pertussis]